MTLTHMLMCFLNFMLSVLSLSVTLLEPAAAAGFGLDDKIFLLKNIIQIMSINLYFNNPNLSSLTEQV